MDADEDDRYREKSINAPNEVTMDEYGNMGVFIEQDSDVIEFLSESARLNFSILAYNITSPKEMTAILRQNGHLNASDGAKIAAKGFDKRVLVRICFGKPAGCIEFLFEAMKNPLIRRIVMKTDTKLAEVSQAELKEELASSEFSFVYKRKVMWEIVRRNFLEILELMVILTNEQITTGFSRLPTRDKKSIVQTSADMQRHKGNILLMFLADDDLDWVFPFVKFVQGNVDKRRFLNIFELYLEYTPLAQLQN